MMKNRINKKQLILLSVVLPLMLTGCDSAQDKQVKYQKRGNEYFAEDNYDKARIEYKNALQIDPKSAEAHFLLARTEEKFNNYQQAAGHYLKTIELDEKHARAMTRMGRIYLVSGAIDKATEIAEKSFALAPKNANTLALRGAIQIQKGNKEAGINYALEARKIDPGNTDAISLLVSKYVNEKNLDEAIKILEEGIKFNQKDAALRLLLANLNTRAGRDGRAIELLQEVITLEPTKLAHRVSLARFYENKSAFSEAERVLRTAVKDLPDRPEIKLGLVSYLKQQQGIKVAEAQLLSFIKDSPDNYELKFGLAKIYMNDKNTADAVKVYEDIIKIDGVGKDGLKSRNLLARIRIAEKNLDSANKLIAEVLKENTQDSDALMMRGMLALSQNKLDSAIADFRSVLKDNPNLPEVLRNLARAHLANNEPALARKQYEKAVVAAPTNVTLQLELAQLYLNAKDPDRAVKQVEMAVKNNPQDLKALEALYKIQIVRKDQEGILDVINKMKAIEKSRAAGFYAAGLMYQSQNKLEESKTEFVEGLKIQPGSLKMLTALTRTFLLQKKSDEAIKFLQEQLKEAKLKAPIHNLLGEVYLSKKQQKIAGASFQRAVENSPEWYIPYRNLVAIEIQNGNKQAAIEIYKKAQDATKGNSMITYGLASLYESTGQTDEAINQFEEVVSKLPDSPVAINNLAMLLANYRDDFESLERASSLIEPLKKSDNPNYLDTVGWVYYKRGEYKQAIPFLQKAVAKSPDVPVIQYHIGMALLKSGDKLIAKQHLEKALESKYKFFGKNDAKTALDSLDES